MNHTRIAAEALRYRFKLVRVPIVDDSDIDLELIAGATVAAADPAVDSALRRIATAWVRAGIDPERLCQSWDCPETEALFAERPDLVDALDDIVRVATHTHAA